MTKSDKDGHFVLSLLYFTYEKNMHGFSSVCKVETEIVLEKWGKSE